MLNVGQVFARKLIRPFAGKCNANDVPNEARAVDKLCRGVHANIVTVFDHGRLSPDSSFYFIDMEFCQINLADYIYGTSLTVPPLVVWEEVKASGDLHLSVICDIMKQVLEGLIFIHEHDEVHRDLDPLNGIHLSHII
jgi:serine/threonine protein kinase